jgi:hypothetical protein
MTRVASLLCSVSPEAYNFDTLLIHPDSRNQNHIEFDLPKTEDIMLGFTPVGHRSSR